MSVKPEIHTLKRLLSRYAKLHIRQVHFELVEKVAQERAKIFYRAIIGMAVFFLFLFSSVFLALWAGSWFDNPLMGFGLITLLWSIITLGVVLLKRRLILTIMHDFLQHNIPKNYSHE